MTELKFELVDLLKSISKNERRGELAALRRGASDPFHNFEALRIIGHTIDEQSDRAFKNSMLLATLFALHPLPIDTDIEHNEKKQNLGAVLKKIRNSIDVGADSLDKKFTLLISADYEDLPYLLIQIFRYIAGSDFAIDYNQLLFDLNHWTHPDKFVQFQWAKSYWSKEKDDNNKDSKNQSDDN